MELFAGRYLLVDPIGEGGMGSVWRAWDARRRRYVAAKLLHPSDAGTLLRFVREQGLRIVHPHVVAPDGWAGDDALVLLTMDLVGGGTLHQLIGDHGALPVSYAAVLVDQLLSALAEVHAHGVVHRDVKPANLLLEPTGRGAPVLRLSDFGISQVLGQPRLTELAAVMGTYGYLSPEAMAGEDPHPSHDLYAAAVVAHQILTGEAPPPEGVVMDDAPPPDVPGPVWDLLGRMLSADPAQRPADAATARDGWRAAVAGVPPPEPDADDPVEVFDQLGPLPTGFGPAGPLPAPVADRRRRAAGIAALVVGALGAVVAVTSAVLLVV
ncbi:serine/threonine-protein kinase [Stackebrandtia albiflava]|uniref:non-specific serine/threonine protein kinase n=1 Tax=Stackebrandtia albiflava TaxID=406432 RepID=A0A562VAY3_9ACTN|nr:serine/threonine-protein kinase [Stackebrandtia albiflava]TWJ15001.1 serine/threonine-protein kinase [Stackebrandtia albiflava]